MTIYESYSKQALNSLIKQNHDYPYHRHNQFRSPEQLALKLRNQDVKIADYDRIQLKSLSNILAKSSGYILDVTPTTIQERTDDNGQLKISD